MPQRMLTVAIGLVILAGCNPQPAGPPAPMVPTSVKKVFVDVPETPPPLRTVAYRPEFELGNRTASAGTAFVIRSKAGDSYLLTAAHLFEPAEWATVKSVVLRDFKGNQMGISTDPAIYVGKGMEPDRNETEFDLVIFKLLPGGSTIPLKLAADYPNHIRFWVVGSEVTSRDGLQKAFELNPLSTVSGKNTVLLIKPAPFNLQAFSGGPIVDHEGKVVATLLGGNEDSVIGSSVANLRRRLEAKGIQPE